MRALLPHVRDVGEVGEKVRGRGDQKSGEPSSTPAGEPGPDILFRISYPRRVLGVVLQLVPSYTLYRMSISYLICTCVQLEA